MVFSLIKFIKYTIYLSQFLSLQEQLKGSKTSNYFFIRRNHLKMIRNWPKMTSFCLFLSVFDRFYLIFTYVFNKILRILKILQIMDIIKNKIKIFISNIFPLILILVLKYLYIINLCIKQILNQYQNINLLYTTKFYINIYSKN